MMNSQAITKEDAAAFWPVFNHALSELPVFYRRIDLVILHHARNLLELLASPLSPEDREIATRQLIPTRLAIRRATTYLVRNRSTQEGYITGVSNFADSLERIRAAQ